MCAFGVRTRSDTFRKILWDANAEPEPGVRFSYLPNSEPERRVQFGPVPGLKTREYPAAVSSRRTPNASRTHGVHVAVRHTEVLYAPPWRQECWTRHRVVGTLSPCQNATRRSNSEVACSRLGHTERDWGPQGRQSVVAFECILGTSVASEEGTSRGEEAAGGGGG
ncbi:hypothetical protein DFH09DRAFT_1104175 [Mycena vulgaris]|nr:hypothetical protein DFH09DRAFT_1104175 [Mycena vulgaris]